MVPASGQHQILVRFLLSLLNLYVEAHDLGWLITAPFLMRLSPVVAREPDLLFVTNQHRDRVKETHLDGPADLAIEIVSPDSIASDRGEKFVEYEATGVSEYCLSTHYASRSNSTNWPRTADIGQFCLTPTVATTHAC